MKRIFYTIITFMICYSHSFAQDCVPTAHTVLNANNVAADLLNGGDFFWDLYDGGYEVPQGSGKNSLFSGALWMGGIDEIGQLRVAAQTYRQDGIDFFPGIINKSGDADMCNEFDRFFEVKSEEIENFRADFDENGENINISTIPENILNWPGKNNPHFSLFTLPSDKNLAPFYDNNGDGNYNPVHGDYPVIVPANPESYAHQMVWWVFNDLAEAHTETGGMPLEVEVRAIAYSYYEGIEDIDNTTFYKFEVENRNQYVINDMYLGLFIDADLGNFTDDFVGCSPTLNLGYTYNGDGFDDGDYGYGENPPVIGIQLLQSPKDETGNELGMTHFNFYNNDFTVTGNPENAQHIHNYLQGKWKDDTPQTFGGTGYGGDTPTNYMFPSNPSTPLGENVWSECSEGNQPADRRFVMSSGPFQMESGETVPLAFAVIWKDGSNFTYPCPDISPLLSSANFINSVYTALCETPYVNTGVSNKNLDIQIFPNPTTQFINISTSTFTAPQTIEIFNSEGKRVVFDKKMTTNHQISLKSVPSGTYWLKISEKGEVIKVEKIVIE